MNSEPSLYDVLEQCGTLRRFAKDELIHLQEDTPSSFYMIKSGKIRSYIISDEGKQITLEILPPGMLFGAVSYFNRLPRPTTGSAVTDAELISIDFGRLEPILLLHPRLMSEMFGLIGYSIFPLTVQISSIAFLPARKKIAHILLNMSQFFKNKPNERQYAIPYTHQNIAELAGVNRVTATRILHDFSGRGWIDLSYKNIAVRDEKALSCYLRA